MRHARPDPRTAGDALVETASNAAPPAHPTPAPPGRSTARSHETTQNRRKRRARPAETACDSLHWPEGAPAEAAPQETRPALFPSATSFSFAAPLRPSTRRRSAAEGERAQRRVKECSGGKGAQQKIRRGLPRPWDRRAGVPWRHRGHHAEGLTHGGTDGTPGAVRVGGVSKSATKASHDRIGRG